MRKGVFLLMFGGTAKTFVNWKQLTSPYKEGKVYYIDVENPNTGKARKVRWYTDKAHADLMPTSTQEETFTGTLFGFKDKADYILAIPERFLSEDEVHTYFDANWKHGGKWRFGSFLGGIWYAPKDAKVPPIHESDNVMRVTWPQFVQSAQSISAMRGFTGGFWDKEVI